MPGGDGSADLAGAILNRRLKLLRRLGVGGMGAVYEAEHGESGQHVAVKILHPEFVGEPEVQERFLAEAKVAQRLIHPNVVRVFEAERAENGSPYLVMELLQGVALAAYTRNGGRVPVGQATSILQGILAGLAVAHQAGIVHRDLKPDNVFLAREPSGSIQVKLLDFGVAKVMDVAGGMGKKTKTGTFLGTPAYMSPEQVKSSKDVDVRTDLWSAGVMFYEMLAGRPAFPAPTDYARLVAVMTSVPEPIERIDPRLAAVGPFLARALEKEKERRYVSALEMARALAGTQGAALGDLSPSQPAALSRLPDVPSMYAPSLLPPSPQAQSGTTKVSASAPPVPMAGPGGTLASPAGRAISIPPPPQVQVVSTQGTLPSQDLPMLPAVAHGAPRFGAGVPVAAVIVLVLVALAAGFCLGYVVGHAMPLR
jgi:serine/threonine-protein kinase